MSFRPARRRLAVLGALMTAVAPLGVLALTSGTAAGAPPDREQHCVAQVTGQLSSGELTLTDPDCYSSLDTALAVGAGGTEESMLAAASGSGGGASTQSSTLLAIHFDGLYLTGSTFSVWGSSCSANGWINMSPSWNNKISSTSSVCAVWHHDGFNLTGALEYLTAPGGNLGALNNRTSSAQYTT